MTGGSAKANANFGPGLYEMEFISLDGRGEVLHDWRIAGKMKEAGGGGGNKFTKILIRITIL